MKSVAPGPGDFVFGEAAVIHDTHRIAHSEAFLLHGAAPGLIVTEAQAVSLRYALRIKPKGPLPATDLSENSPLCSQGLVKRCLLNRSRRGENAVGKGNGILQAVELGHPLDGIVRGRPVTEAARVPGGQVPFCFAFGDPFRDGLAGGGGLGDADLDTASMVEIRQAGGGPAERLRIRRIGDGGR